MTFKELKQELTGWRFSNYKLFNFIVGAIAFLLYAFICRPYYRPHISSQQVPDFSAVSTLGNTLATIAAIFIPISILTNKKVNGLYLVRIITLAMIVFELGQPLLGKPIDPWGVLAAFLGGLISYVVFWWRFGKVDE